MYVFIYDPCMYVGTYVFPYECKYVYVHPYAYVRMSTDYERITD